MEIKAYRFILRVLIFVMALLPASVRAETISLVGFGDSLMAGYQLPAADAFPARLEKALREKGYDIAIANAGVSGDTSSGGLARIDWSVPDEAKGVILELGANDALRGIPPEQTEKNLRNMIVRLQARGISVLLAGILAPPNMGDDYAARFNPIFPKLAADYGIPLYGFFLDGVVTEASLKLEDGMHPNADGVGVMVDKFLPVAEQFIKGLSNSEN